MDGVGNAYVYEVSDGSGVGGEWPWSWWPVGAEALTPPKLLAASGFLDVFASPLAGAWLQEDDLRMGVRAFDVGAGDWGPQSLSVQRRADEAFHLEVRGAGQPLGVTVRREKPTRLVVEVQRYDPELEAWQPKETALSTEGDADESPAALGAEVLSSSAFGDTVIANVQRQAGDDLELSRRLPTTGVWSPLQVFHDVQPLYWSFQEDASGDLYGYVGPSEFFHCNAAGNVSLTSLGDEGGFQWVTTARGAFALSSKSGQLLAYRHDGHDWRPARGLPPAIRAEAESRYYGLARLGQDRALVVWTGPDHRGPLYAAFLE
jgi:hypothetical protein